MSKLYDKMKQAERQRRGKAVEATAEVRMRLARELQNRGQSPN